MKKFWENTLTFTVGIIVGSIVGMIISTILLKSLTMKEKEAYEAGYKQAQRECINLIKGAK